MTDPAPTALLFSELAADPEMADLVDLFVAEMPARIDAFQQAFEAGRTAELLRAAHQLKGAAGSYGFAPLTPMAAAVEESVRNGWPASMTERLLAELTDACRMIRAGRP